MSMPAATSEPETKRLLSLADVAHLFNVSVDSIRRLRDRDPNFPAPIRVIPGRPRWPANVIRQYIDDAAQAAEL